MTDKRLQQPMPSLQATAVSACAGKHVFPAHGAPATHQPLAQAAAPPPTHAAAAACCCVLPWMTGSRALAPSAAAAAAQQGSMLPGAPMPQFALPVDAECKACRLQLCSFARPHMRAFHISWAAFFIAFVTTFAPAALLPVLRDSLELTATDIGNGGIASVCGAIGSRLVIGTFTDVFGPRYAAATVLLLTAPFAFGMVLVRNAAGYIAMRCMVGLGLSVFVVNQTWTTCMFNVKLVGRANALSAGWGNTGGGAALLLTPLLFEAFATGLARDVAWRLALFVPGVLQLLAGLLVLGASDDAPLGSFPQLSRDRGHFRRTNPCSSWRVVLANYRVYVLGLAYALCFGVELTSHNVISLYLFSHFGLSLTASGFLAGGVGMLNVASRFMGGSASDLAASARGMRGRLWVLQALLLLEGAACLLVGVVHNSLPATVVMLVVFSFCCQMGCGAVFGIVPFVSKRSMGTVTGVVAAIANLGSAVTQAAFFSHPDVPAYTGFYWMGASVICLSAATSLLYWPMWGGMFGAKKPGTSEERYYISEYSSGERAAGLHLPALAFAHEARSERDDVSCCGTPGRPTWRQRWRQWRQQRQQQGELGCSTTLAPAHGGGSVCRASKGLDAPQQQPQLAVAAAPVPAAGGAAGGEVGLAPPQLPPQVLPPAGSAAAGDMEQALPGPPLEVSAAAAAAGGGGDVELALPAVHGTAMAGAVSASELEVEHSCIQVAAAACDTAVLPVDAGHRA